MGPIKQYLAEEVALDHADGLLSRREALRRLGMLGFGAVAAGSLLAACATDDDGGATATPGTATDSPPRRRSSLNRGHHLRRAAW